MQTGIKMQVCDCALRSPTAVAWTAKIMVQRAGLSAPKDMTSHKLLSSMHNTSSVHMNKRTGYY